MSVPTANALGRFLNPSGSSETSWKSRSRPPQLVTAVSQLLNADVADSVRPPQRQGRSFRLKWFYRITMIAVT
jgi:hypothetical protein